MRTLHLRVLHGRSLLTAAMARQRPSSGRRVSARKRSRGNQGRMRRTKAAPGPMPASGGTSMRLDGASGAPLSLSLSLNADATLCRPTHFKTEPSADKGPLPLSLSFCCACAARGGRELRERRVGVDHTAERSALSGALSNYSLSLSLSLFALSLCSLSMSVSLCLSLKVSFRTMSLP